MPELPEVETVRRGLEKYLVRHEIVGVEVKLQKIITGDTVHVIGATVKEVRRMGKGLIIDLNNDYSIAVHIKLTGQLIYTGRRTRTSVSVPNKWTHVIFNLDKGGVLYYNDLRQFGWIKIIKTSEVKNLPFFRELGPEPSIAGPAARYPHPMSSRSLRALDGGPPLASPAILTLDLFKKIVSNRSTKIKPLLMDQKKIGGVGNIYANDALWLAGIDPRRPAKSLSSVEQAHLYNSILEVLRRGLKHGGATEINFVNVLGQEGQYQNHFLAYGQEGQPCQRCHRYMKKIKLAGRGTYFCERCQK